MSNDIDIESSGDNRGIIAGRDVRDANLINTDDVTGSYNAIGVGAQVVINQIQQARTAIDRLSAGIRLAESQLASAVTRKVEQLTAAVKKSAHTARRNPYRSLLDYRLEDAPFFYGRDDAINELLGKIHDHRLTILHADSGSGKSSLLQAGLMSRLLAAGHLPLRLRPYRQEPTPFVKKTFLTDLETLPELERFQKMSLVGYLQSITSYLGDSTLYLFLDQFEEFFTELPRDKHEKFAQELADCLDNTGLDVRWVLSIRKEFFSNLSLFQPRIEPFVNEYFLPTFTPEEAKAVIIQPARRRNVTYENGLVETILTDLCDEDGSLQPPQVQLVCYALFEEVLQADPDDCITVQLYNQPRGRGGAGARGILSSHLSRELERMSAAERTIARQLLEGLITSQTRRAQRRHDDLLDELRQRSKQMDVQQVDRILADLVSSRLLRTDEAEDDQPLYELAHDYLLTVIEIDPETLARKAAQELLNQEVVAWQADSRLRIGEEKLRILEEHDPDLHISPHAARLMQLSREAIGRRRRTVRYSYGAAGVALVVALLAGIVAMIFSGQAGDAQDQLTQAHTAATAMAVQQATAEAAATAIAQEIDTLHSQANAISLANAASALLDEDPELAVLLSTYALDHEVYTQEAERALRKSLLRYYTFATMTHEATWPNIAYGVDAKTIFSGDDHQIRSWTIESGEPAGAWDKAAPYSSKTVVSPAGDYVATAYFNPKEVAIQLFNLANGESRSLGGHAASVMALSFSSDGQWLASSDLSGQAHIWEVATGATIATFSALSAVNSVAIHPDKSYLATGEQDGAISVWDIKTEALVFSNTAASPIYSIAYSPDSTKLATAERDLRVNLWDAKEANHLLESAAAHTDAVLDVAFAPDGKRLLSADVAGIAILWDISDGMREIRRYVDYGGGIYDVAFSPDGRTVATSDHDKMVRVWVTPAHDNGIIDLLFDPLDPTRFLSVSLDHTARLWRHVAGRRTLLYTLEHPDGVRRGAFSHDGHLIATASAKGQLFIWDAQTAQLLQTLSGHTDSIGGITFSTDDKWLISVGWEGVARVWDAASWTEVTALSYRDSAEKPIAINDVAMDPATQEIATAGNDGTVRFWTVQGELLDELRVSESPVERINYSDHARVLALAAGNVVMLWDALNHTPIYTMTQHTDRVFGLAFDPAGKALVSAGNDGQVIAWDVNTGRALQTFVDLGTSEYSVAFSADGRYLAWAGNDGEVYIQGFSLEELVAQAHARVKRWWREDECEKYLGSSTCPIQPSVVRTSP